MNVARHAPKPVPVTYDLVGLTWEEVLVIRHALMRAGEAKGNDTPGGNAYKPAEAERLHVEISQKQSASERTSDDR